MSLSSAFHIIAADYEGMFTSLLNRTDPWGREVKSEIPWARKVLKKNDRIVWWLRWFKLALLKSSTGKDTTKPYQQALAEAKRRCPDPEVEGSIPIANSNAMQFFHQEMQHFFSLPIPAIQNYHPEWKTPRTVVKDLKAIEADWAQQTSGVLDIQEGDTVLIQFPDGSAWWKLSRGYCPEEGKAMGHCGNGGTYNNGGETILSYRTPKKAQNGQRAGWQPHLTFILRNEDGSLGEMKGRNNTRPTAKYFPYIIELLKNPNVKALHGGGYKPEANFHMEDLDEKTRESLFAMKPGLMTLTDLYAREGDCPEVRTKIQNHYQQEYDETLPWNETINKFVIQECASFSDLIESHGTRYTKQLLEQSEGGMDFWDSGLSQEDEAGYFWDGLKKEETEKIGKIVALKFHQEIEEWEEQETESFTYRDNTAVWNFVKFTEWDDLIHAMAMGYSDGHRLGAESEMSEALHEGVAESQWLAETPDSPWDSKYYLANTTADMMDMVEDNCSVDNHLDGNSDFAIDVSEPYHGWNRYDESAALETFHDMFDVDALLDEAMADSDNAEALAAMEVDDKIEAEFEQLLPRIKELLDAKKPTTVEQKEWNQAVRELNQGYTGRIIPLVRSLIPGAFAFVEGVESKEDEAAREAEMAGANKSASIRKLFLANVFG